MLDITGKSFVASIEYRADKAWHPFHESNSDPVSADHGSYLRFEPVEYRTKYQRYKISTVNAAGDCAGVGLDTQPEGAEASSTARAPEFWTLDLRPSNYEDKFYFFFRSTEGERQAEIAEAVKANEVGADSIHKCHMWQKGNILRRYRVTVKEFV